MEISEEAARRIYSARSGRNAPHGHFPAYYLMRLEHPAVLELIGHTAEEGHRLGRRVALCGQLGADLTATETLLRLGVDELSVPPAAVLPLREKIRGLDLSGPAE